MAREVRVICPKCKGSGINRHSGHACDHCDGTGWFHWMDALTPWVVVILIVGVAATVGKWLWQLFFTK